MDKRGIEQRKQGFGDGDDRHFPTLQRAQFNVHAWHADHAEQAKRARARF